MTRKLVTGVRTEDGRIAVLNDDYTVSWCHTMFGLPIVFTDLPIPGFQNEEMILEDVMTECQRTMKRIAESN